MWIVIQEYVKGELYYRAMNKETEEKLGLFDSERNVLELVLYKNEKDSENGGNDGDNTNY